MGLRGSRSPAHSLHALVLTAAVRDEAVASPIDRLGVGVRPSCAGDPPGRLAQFEHERRERMPRGTGCGPAAWPGESWPAHALTQIGDIDRPAVPVGRYPRISLITRAAAGAEGLLDMGSIATSRFDKTVVVGRWPKRPIDRRTQMIFRGQCQTSRPTIDPHSAANLYPTPGSVRRYRGRVGFASSLRRSCMM